MPYLEVNQGNQDEGEIKEAEKILKDAELELCVEEITEENKEKLDKENTIIKEQIPTEGIKINKGNKIFIKY